MNTDKIKPVIIAPVLIEQSTWGGDYILEHKGLKTDSKVKIGQSYELFEHSRVCLDTYKTSHHPCVYLGDPQKPETWQQLSGDKTKTQTLEAYISQDPDAILGRKAKSKMRLLIKFNQAKGNSYQLHVPEATQKWLPKPESWYYFKPGLVTLGVKPDIDWQEYQDCCQKLYDYSQVLSQQVQAKKLTLDQAKTKMHQAIEADNPARFVNHTMIKKGGVVDLSAGAIHHSWEESDQFPEGNIVFEVQLQAYDDQSTIRAFDKGKFKDDGSVRQLTIDDYFKHINRDPKYNLAKTHLKQPKIIKKTSSYTLTQLFKTQNYQLKKLSLRSQTSHKQILTSGSFTHAFVESGQVDLQTQNSKWTLTQGYGIFIPACISQVQLKPKKQAKLLLTSVPN